MSPADHEGEDPGAVHTVTASPDVLQSLSWRHVRWIIAPLTALLVVLVLPDTGVFWTVVRWVIGLPAAAALAYHFLALNGVDAELERREASSTANLHRPDAGSGAATGKPRSPR